MVTQVRGEVIDKELATCSYYSGQELKSLNTCKRVCDSHQQGGETYKRIPCGIDEHNCLGQLKHKGIKIDCN